MMRIVIPTRVRDNQELGSACINLRADATIRMPKSKNGASKLRLRLNR
jgi:hypothetical protein